MKRLFGLFIIVTLLVGLTSCSGITRDMYMDESKEGAELHTVTTETEVVKAFTTGGDYVNFSLLLMINDKEANIEGFMTLDVNRAVFLGAEKGDSVKVYFEYYSYADGSVSAPFNEKAIETNIAPIYERLKMKGDK